MEKHCTSRKLSQRLVDAGYTQQTIYHWMVTEYEGHRHMLPDLVALLPRRITDVHIEGVRRTYCLPALMFQDLWELLPQALVGKRGRRWFNMKKGISASGAVVRFGVYAGQRGGKTPILALEKLIGLMLDEGYRIVDGKLAKS